MTTQQGQLDAALRRVREGDMLRVITFIKPDRSLVTAAEWKDGVLRLTDPQYIEIRPVECGWVLVRTDGFQNPITAIYLIADGRVEWALAS